MTGIADIYLYFRRPHSADARARMKAMFRRDHKLGRVVVLSWKRTGSNLLCGILHHHPEIVMHNELFNPVDIFTYHPKALLQGEDNKSWNVLGRDLWPEAFLEHIWSGKYANEQPIVEDAKIVGFKSFPDHWAGPRNQKIFEKLLLDDHRVKKVILVRDDELAVYVSMKRAEITGNYMTHKYPDKLKIHIKPVDFQAFVNNYRDTFKRKYKSPTCGRDTFRVSYEQLIDEDNFEKTILPLLWRFLGVDEKVTAKRLKETVKQADPNEDLAKIIENYEELEFAFRHTDVLHFSLKNDKRKEKEKEDNEMLETDKLELKTWSLLLPICSRLRGNNKSKAADPKAETSSERTQFNANRFIELVKTSQYTTDNTAQPQDCWTLLETFGKSLKDTSSNDQLKLTECVVGVDVDDPVFNIAESKDRIRKLMEPALVRFIEIPPVMYGRVCRIWNHLASKARNDFIVLLGDDILLLDEGWQESVVQQFHIIATKTGLPYGAGCVAMNDISFPGFPTFPVIHRWHMNQFRRLLPKQFVNQGGDPYLFELYSRYNASYFASNSRLKNTIGGDDEARYKKHAIYWQGQILNLGLMSLRKALKGKEEVGICLDIVVPCYRLNNIHILSKIMKLRPGVEIYTKFWIIVDNPCPINLQLIKDLAEKQNSISIARDGNYFVNVISYAENRGASYARNTGYNYSTADWVVFLDDDVLPEPYLLDAYVGAIQRHPKGKVFVGLTVLPEPFNLWTRILQTSNIMYFYGIAQRHTYPSWGVTANLMVRGARHHHTIQFKGIYPRTGGGEDIDFVFQIKEWYQNEGKRSVVAVPGAKVCHPWWNNGGLCYKHIRGWAWGDSLCLSEWTEKTYFTFPNWIEFIVCILPLFGYFTRNWFGATISLMVVVLLNHLIRGFSYFDEAKRVGKEGWYYSAFLAVGAGTVVSSQEITRVFANLIRVRPYLLCRRMDWFDGQARIQIIDEQLRSLLWFLLYSATSWLLCSHYKI